MTQPARARPYTYMCAVCMKYNHRQRKAEWLTPEGWHVCGQHREHAETHRMNTLTVKPR